MVPSAKTGHVEEARARTGGEAGNLVVVETSRAG